MPAFHVETATHINAPRSQVHAALVDFNTWPIWSPWLYIERDASLTYEGTRGEPGHGYSWEGKKIGAGGMQLLSSTEQRIDCKLNFLKPFKSEADVAFDLAAVDDRNTQVTWLMDSSLPFFMFWMTSTMTAMIRADYDRGLTMLKDYIETGSVPSKCTPSEIVNVEAQHFVGCQSSTPMATIGESMTESFSQVMGSDVEKVASGVPFVIYNQMDLKGSQCTYTAAIPVAQPQTVNGPLVSGERAACRALRVVHSGPYRHLSNGWNLAMNEVRQQKLKSAKGQPPFERYLNDPDTTAEEDLLTEIYMPLRA